jgi:hypothetical protein
MQARLVGRLVVDDMCYDTSLTEIPQLGDKDGIRIDLSCIVSTSRINNHMIVISTVSRCCV